MATSRPFSAKSTAFCCAGVGLSMAISFNVALVPCDSRSPTTSFLSTTVACPAVLNGRHFIRLAFLCACRVKRPPIFTACLKSISFVCKWGRQLVSCAHHGCRFPRGCLAKAALTNNHTFFSHHLLFFFSVSPRSSLLLLYNNNNRAMLYI